MKLSIITINYNNVNGLKKTIDSIVCQTWRDFEWIIIDGGSTDGSKELIEQVAAEEKNNVTYWCSEPDKGIYNAMNKGIDKAKGEWLNFMNSGDGFYEKETLEKVFGCEINGDIIYGQSLYCYSDKDVYRDYPLQIDKGYFLDGHHINHQSIFIKNKIQQKIKYDESYMISADYKLLMECLWNGYSFNRIDCLVVKYDATGISQKQVFDAWSEAQKIREEFVVDNYLLAEYKELYLLCKKRRVTKRIVLFVARIFNRFL